ncbi:hypothetical protein OQJ68_10775 [Microbulbifer thermotolerans]|uniref:Uncharacterized protein n=1 Tax=Microbulbifer thermotolerans TaxID=252514 RepID=A0AB35HXT4_MICTH|nr:hypothetical protein [Microbulbifer thermotolerans]MCX2802269.1 hypothetical protein [Microbulbifer thermotolerans]
MNTNASATTTATAIRARLERALLGSLREFENDREWYQEDDTTWTTVPAVVRVLRRTLGLSRHGLAPESVFRLAVRVAERLDELYWDSRESTPAIVREVLSERVRSIRRLIRRARKGTLAA